MSHSMYKYQHIFICCILYNFYHNEILFLFSFHFVSVFIFRFVSLSLQSNHLLAVLKYVDEVYTCITVFLNVSFYNFNNMIIIVKFV